MKVKNFWQKLKKPILILAPMANVTDAAFRRIIAKYGKPDVIWTEFVSANGLASAAKKRLLPDLWFSPSERPIVAQLFTGDPQNLAPAVRLVERLGFDGVDLNMGCPDRGVEKSAAGASLIKNPTLARELIRSMRKNTKLPISVKTRLGYNTISLSWIAALLEEKPDALTIHLRTRKEMSDVPAHWEVMPEIIRLRDKISPDTLIFGNGDIATPKEGREKCRQYGCDGVMIGRGIFGNPWLFGKRKKISPREKLKVLLEHSRLFEKYFRGLKNFAVMRKHFKAYVSGWENAKELRIKLMETNTAKDVEKIIRDFLKEKG
jgi:nifR3 family TIM-barrel protein